MNWLKQNKIPAIAVLILVALVTVSGAWYVNLRAGNDKEKTAFDTGFVLMDDETSLIYSQNADLDAASRAAIEAKVKEIMADIKITANQEQLLADYNNLGLFQKYLGNYRESYDAYLNSLKLESRARVAWQNFADVLYKMKAVKSAEFAYKKAIELNKFIPESYVKLADFYRLTAQNDKIEEVYTTGLATVRQSMESDILVLTSYGDWLASQKRYADAIKIYEELITKQPQNQAALGHKIENLRSKM